MAHTLPDLPYAHDALAPVISKETLEFHHGKHHGGYVKKLNAALEGTAWANAPLIEILQNLDRFPEGKRTAVFNNGAQHFNHSFYWKCMSPNGGGEPSGALAKALEASFGSSGGFKERFFSEASTHFGSGWAWLVQTADGGLEVLSTHDADTPVAKGLTPLLTADVWEHAYYIDYRNDRAAYLQKFWDVVNWDFVASNFSG